MEKLYNSLSLIFFWVLFIMANLVFNKIHLYDYFYWLDIGMHIWGGMMFIWSWYHFHTDGGFRKMIYKPFVHPLLALGILVVGWELYRFLLKNIIVEDYALDTTIDILVGLSGGIIAYLWFSSRTIEK
jgi:hypothetical protein